MKTLVTVYSGDAEVDEQSFNSESEAIGFASTMQDNGFKVRLTPGESLVDTTAAMAVNSVTSGLTSLVTLFAEIVVVLFIGAIFGYFYQAKTVLSDCDRINLAKVGENYVQCSIIEPKKVIVEPAK